MLDRDGSVLATTGPVRPSDARLRRAQALARETGVAVAVARELITQKLAGQEQVARDRLKNEGVAQTIAGAREGPQARRKRLRRSGPWKLAQRTHIGRLGAKSRLLSRRPIFLVSLVTGFRLALGSLR